MKITIILFPGTNRENDMVQAFRHVCSVEPEIVWHKETSIGDTDLIVLPGGFSYGDYLRSGAMAAKSPVMSEVIAKANQGVRVFGVCNGFQMLVETGLLPGALLHNRDLKFICKQVNLKCFNNDTDFTCKIKDNDIIKVPVAHGEGAYFADEKTLNEIKSQDMIAFKYCDENGDYTKDSNINGSIDNIAGVLNKNKTVLGMMPHPENAILDHHNTTDGRVIFESILSSLF